MGRGKDNNDSGSDHIARPLTDLKDPATFAPPPRRTGSGLAPAPKPVSAKRSVISSPSKYADPRAGPVEPPPRNTGRGYEDDDAPITMHDDEDEGPHEPKPYQMNTTGLSTDNLPKPPGRRDGADVRGPPSYNDATRGTVQKALPPSLPPRLPPRGAAGEGEKNTSNNNGGLNEGAMNRLGAAGLSVPALGIGRGAASSTSSPSPPPPASRASPSSGTGNGKWGAQVNELQGRFSKMNTSSQPSSAQDAPSEGTTWTQKQAALKTASAFQKDPSSVSFADAKAAAGTANNFRQRHGEQVAAGAKAANSFNQKYGVADKVGAYAASSQNSQTAVNKSSPPPLPGPGQAYTGVTNETPQKSAQGVAGKKKPPPPPPKKKPGLAASTNPPSTSQGDGPPPVPMSTRPQF